MVQRWPFILQHHCINNQIDLTMTKVHQAVLSRTKFGDFGGVLAHHVMTSLYLLDPLKLVASHSEKSDPLLTGLKSSMPYTSDICPTPDAMEYR
jgi:hypothetical protein